MFRPLLALSVVLVGVSAHALTFEERVNALEAVERAQHTHRIGVTPPFETVRPRAALAEEVRTTLEQSWLLRERWGVALDASALDAEIERMRTSTSMPARLDELFRVLGRNATLVRETLARPVLADGRIREAIAWDREIQNAARLRAEAWLERSLADRPGASGAIDETDVAFVARVWVTSAEEPEVIDRKEEPKEGWESWRSTLGTLDEAVDRAEVEPVPSRGPLVVAASGECVPDDSWINGGLDDWPDPAADATAVWTGTEMVVWGGRLVGLPAPGGGAFNPGSGKWRRLPTAGAPSPRFGHSMVWTGKEVLIWGGRTTTYATSGLGDGGRLELATGIWKPISTIGAPPSRFDHAAVWTGREMIVWGGAARWDGGPPPGGVAGAAYDPESDRWRPLAAVGAPPTGRGASAVWCGDRMFVWGGNDARNHRVEAGGFYDPATDRWETIPVEGGPGAVADASAFWLGDRILVWDGTYASGNYAWNLRLYDPQAARWRPLAQAARAHTRNEAVAVWTGDSLLVHGGASDGSGVGEHTFRYILAEDRWVELRAVGGGRWRHVGVWTGSELVLWGGRQSTFDDPTDRQDRTIRINPTADLATLLAPTIAPPMYPVAAVWTGNEVVVTGSLIGLQGLVQVWKYRPALDRWERATGQPGPLSQLAFTVWTGRFVAAVARGTGSTLEGWRYEPWSRRWDGPATTGAPTKRDHFTVTWTGTEAVVWGGTSGVPPTAVNHGDGARYDPDTQVWRSMSAVGTPAARHSHSAVWSGNEVLVWGGDDRRVALASGGAYDPKTDRWRPMSASGAPTPRTVSAAVWSGNEMLYWGGYTPSYVRLPSGGAYDPVLDRWRPIPPSPEPRTDPATLWTGSDLLVVGGTAPGSWKPAIRGMRYRPELDAWTRTREEGAPDATWGAAVTMMDTTAFVWGGQVGSGTVAVGGRYGTARCNTPPVSDAGPDQDLECAAAREAVAVLDGSASRDVDSTEGTHDDIVEFRWSIGATEQARAIRAEIPVSLGVSVVALRVTDRAGATDDDEASIAVRDTSPPAGTVVAPPPGACFGPGSVPVTVRDSFVDACEPEIARTYEPEGGPEYGVHGDHHVRLTASDASGNAARAEVRFTIDREPPAVAWRDLASRPWIVGETIAFSSLFESDDDDEAAGGVTREAVSIAGCTVWDGATLGDRDGRLADESVVLTVGEWCRIATACGFVGLREPELRVEAADCGGNVGSARTVLRGSLTFRPGICGR